MSISIRDPIHGFIELSSNEVRIVNSKPFQRLRNIHQLALTYLVYPGAVHTRFEHSLGVMHLVTAAFRAAVENSSEIYNIQDEKKAYYEQILRLMALCHDVGHAPYSHASEDLFPNGLEHEDYTEKIVCNTEIAEIIRDIGNGFAERYGEKYIITPELICNIYLGKDSGENAEFSLLKSFMDSELDCDKMDYLLRDSYYCGVKYGNFDKDRLIESFTIYKSGGMPRLAIKPGGVQAVEEFVLARYFMFIQVYFHKTRRYFDIMLSRALKQIMPNQVYPEQIEDFLEWDDIKAYSLIREKSDTIVACSNIVNRDICSCVYFTKTHPEASDLRDFNSVYNELKDKIGEEYFLVDRDADKSPHKIPRRTEIDDEKAIIVFDKRSDRKRTISEESEIIRSLTEKIDIRRLYCHKDKLDVAERLIKEHNERQEEI